MSHSKTSGPGGIFSNGAGSRSAASTSASTRSKSSRILEADLLVVLGGPIGVYEADSYPFLVDETDLIGRRIGLLRPTLGICLGAQLIAKSLGAKVAPGPVKEIGWARVELTDAGQTSPLRHLENVHVLHWHGDNFEFPAGLREPRFHDALLFPGFQEGTKPARDPIPRRGRPATHRGLADRPCGRARQSENRSGCDPPGHRPPWPNIARDRRQDFE